MTGGVLMRAPRYRDGHNWRREAECEVYLLGAQDGAGPLYVKVGMSVSTESRILGVQTGCPIPIVNAMAFTCQSREVARAAEKSLQDHLVPFHSSGEWFRMDGSAESKRFLQRVFSDLMMEARGRQMREIDLSSIRAVRDARGRDRDLALQRAELERQNKHRCGVELRAPYPEP